jgi:hypothetical protein
MKIIGALLLVLTLSPLAFGQYIYPIRGQIAQPATISQQGVGFIIFGACMPL